MPASLLVSAASLAAASGLIAGGYAYAANWPTSQIFGHTLVGPPAPVHGPHPVALTFDDGPSPRNTSALLDALAERSVRATFFLIGEHVRKYPALARRVAEAGHSIGNHTHMHPRLARRNETQTRDELTRCQRMIEDTLGVAPVLFRPPYGSRKPATLRIARELGLTPVLWNITSHDWDPIPFEKLLARVDRGIRKNRRKRVCSNILLHDASHLDGADTFADRSNTVTLTRTLLARPDLAFTTPETWLPA